LCYGLPAFTAYPFIRYFAKPPFYHIQPRGMGRYEMGNKPSLNRRTVFFYLFRFMGGIIKIGKPPALPGWL
jgi:hypothetical protein